MTDRRHHDSSQYLDTEYDRRGDVLATIPANTPELLDLAQRLRHRVYYEEHPEFGLEQQIDHKELDPYDDHAETTLLLYKPLDMVIGSVRMVFPQPNSKHYGLPSLEMANSPFIEQVPFDLSKCCEFTRFLVSQERLKIARQHHGKNINPILHLVRAGYHSALSRNFPYTIAIIARNLIKLLKINKIPVEKFGAEFDYYGPRQGMYIIYKDHYQWMRDNAPKVYSFMCDGAPEFLNTLIDLSPKSTS